jgi:hypothetical protein
MIQITARGEGGTNISRPSRGFHSLAWCPGNALPALRVCVCVRRCVDTSVQAYICVCVCVPSTVCVGPRSSRLAHHPCLRLRLWTHNVPQHQTFGRQRGRQSASSCGMQGWLSLEDTLGACREYSRPLGYLFSLDLCVSVLVEPNECIFNVAEPNSTQCNRDVVSSSSPPPLFNRPRQASIAAASSSTRGMGMQAVPNAEGQLIVVAGSPVLSPRYHGSPSLRYMHFLHCFAVSSRPVTET